LAHGEDEVFRAAVDRVTADRPHGVTVEEALLRLYDHADRASIARQADLDEDDDTIWRSLSAVLHRLDQAPTRDELGELIRRLSSDTFVELTELQEFWVLRARRGDPL